MFSLPINAIHGISRLGTKLSNKLKILFYRARGLIHKALQQIRETVSRR